MCSHSLNGPVDSGLMMGEEECTSPPGYYELLIPVDKNLECSASQMRDTNCKDLDVSFCKLKSLCFVYGKLNFDYKNFADINHLSPITESAMFPACLVTGQVSSLQRLLS